MLTARRASLVFILSAIVCISGSIAHGKSNAASLPLLPDSVVVDGLVEENSWADALMYSFGYETLPRWGEAIEPNGQVQIGATPQGLLIAVTVQQSAPLRATASKHDGLDSSDDAVIVSIRPDVRAQRAYVFTVNAVGATADTITSSSGSGSPDWNGQWISAAMPTKDGFSVEMSVPWETLGIRSQNDVATLGISVERQLGTGRFERQAISLLDRRQNCLECQFLEFVTNRSPSTPPEAVQARWLPYAIATEKTTFDPYAQQALERKTDVDGGLDAMFQIRNGAKALLALNPDFSQVESDAFVSTINRRFAVSFPERRPFFTEDAGAFSTPLALLYTRTIADPLVGAQYIRRDGPRSDAILIADDSATTYVEVGQDESNQVTVPTRSWNGVYRGVRPWSQDSTSTWGSFAAVRNANGYSNVVLATDANWQPSSEHNVIAQIAASRTEVESSFNGSTDSTEEGTAISASHLFARGHYSSSTSFSQMDSGFRADLAILPRVGTRNASHLSNLTWPISGDGPLSTVSTSLSGNVVDDQHGNLLDGDVSMNGSLRFDRAWGLSARATTSATRDEGEIIRTRSVSVGANAFLAHHFIASVALAQGTAPDYVNATEGRNQNVVLSLIVTGFEKFGADVSVVQTNFDSDREPANFSVRSVSSRIQVNPFDKHHFSLSADVADSANRLRVDRPPRENDKFFSWQFVYTFEPSRFTRLIAGASRTELGGQGINGVRPDGQLVFAKVVYEL